MGVYMYIGHMQAGHVTPSMMASCYDVLNLSHSMVVLCIIVLTWEGVLCALSNARGMVKRPVQHEVKPSAVSWSQHNLLSLTLAAQFPVVTLKLCTMPLCDSII